MKFLFIMLILWGNALNAQTPPRTGAEGYVGLSPWYQQPSGKADEENLKGRARVNGWINITSDGCVKIRGRLTTGDRFNNEWVNTGLGTQDSEFSLALRQLYVSATCLKNVTAEAGAVPVRNFGTLGLSDNGAINGLSVVINDEKNNREWIMSLGEVDAVTNLFERNIEEINHASIQLKQKLPSQNLELFASTSLYEETIFSRAGVTWAMEQYVKWIKDVGIEGIFSDEKLMGGILFTRLNTGSWNTRLAVSTINPQPSESDRLAFLMKQFYGYGTNFYLETSKDISPSLTINGRVRVGEAGPMIQGGIAWKFTTAKKKKLPRLPQ
jgi:hypothetical protein